MPRKIKTELDPKIENSRIDRAEKFFAAPEKKKALVRRKAQAKKVVSEQIFSEPLIQENVVRKQIIPEAEVQELIRDVKNEEKTEREIPKKMITMILLGAIFVGALGSAGYFFWQYKKLSSTEASKDEISSYVSKIGKFMTLPEGEIPTMATVADREKLSSQSFFSKAENGDKVLFFSKSQKAILYRPSTNMIIEATSMAGGIPSGTTTQSAPAPESQPVATEQPQTQTIVEQPISEQPVQAPQVEEKISEQATVVVNNGTEKKGLAKTMAEKISQISGVTIASTGNAVGNFEKTVVVDLGGKSPAIAVEIAKNLDGEVLTSLPAGETKPEADILVIAGGK